MPKLPEIYSTVEKNTGKQVKQKIPNKLSLIAQLSGAQDPASVDLRIFQEGSGFRYRIQIINFFLPDPIFRICSI